jgi:predicted DNA-binding WGR domain protein
MGKVIGEHYLHFKEGGSDKGYVIQIIEEADKKYTLYTAWGRVGNTYQTKVREALSLLEAEKERAKIYGEKIGKGYQSVSPEALGFKESSAIVAPMPEGYDALFPDPKPILFTPMLFTAIKSEEKLEALLKDDRYLAQRKMDGTRLVIRITPKAIPGECLIGAHNKKGQLISLRAEIDRNLRILYRKLGKKYWSEEFVLDGEAIGAEFHIFDMLCNDPSMLLVDRIEMIENDIVIKDAVKQK